MKQNSPFLWSTDLPVWTSGDAWPRFEKPGWISGLRASSTAHSRFIGLTSSAAPANLLTAYGRGSRPAKPNT